MRERKLNRLKNYDYSAYDRIIRNERELFFIRRYIQMNPQRWIMDRFY